MGHTFGDSIIVASVAAVVISYLYFRHLGRQRRLEIIHQERMAAMDKGIPLPELPIDPLTVPKAPDPRMPLLHGIVWAALGGGAVVALRLLVPVEKVLWPLPLPLLFLGIGLMLYYFFASDRAR